MVGNRFKTTTSMAAIVGLFSTHSATEERVARLMAMAQSVA